MKFRTLIRRLAYNLLPTKPYLALHYWHIYKRKLNLDNPQFLSEKLYYLKIYNGKYLKDKITLCYDKYTVGEYLSSKGCKKYMKQVYGVYEDANEIDFDILPEQFVLKITQSCGYNIICKDKSKLDIKQTKMQLNEWLYDANSGNKYIAYEESYAFNGNAKIIAEKLYVDINGKKPNEYNLFCFNDKVKLIAVNCWNYSEEKGLDTVPVNTYDSNWNPIKMAWVGGRWSDDVQCAKPATYDEMVSLSQKLAEDFPFVRVDLYDLGDSIVFGELTWIPCGGNAFMNAPEQDRQFGKELKLPDVKLF